MRFSQLIFCVIFSTYTCGHKNINKNFHFSKTHKKSLNKNNEEIDEVVM